jgi:hypothetical protein
MSPTHRHGATTSGGQLRWKQAFPEFLRQGMFALDQ